MDRNIARGRLAFLAAVFALLIAIYGVALYKLQIIEGAEYYERSQNSIVTKQVVTAARGNILDRYGRVLVSNRMCNNIVLDAQKLFYSEDITDPNEVLLNLARIVKTCGDKYTDTLPITTAPPFEYVDNMTDLQKSLLKSFIEYNNIYNKANLGDNPTAVELMAYFRDRYNIDSKYDAEEMRIITGLRYEVNVRYVVNTADYVFVEDASIELITKLLESQLTGFNVEVSYIREYKTNYAAHVLGYVGAMTTEEYERTGGFEDQGYPMSSYVGKDGAEYAFEKYLHGVDGEAAITRTSSGIVTSTIYTKEPEPGEHVYLSLDIGLNEVAENALAKNIREINAKRAADNEKAERAGSENDILPLAKGGAVVAIDVRTGEPLALASYPTYDLSNLMEQYDEIMKADDNPLFNRALMGAYAPGSTFKPVTALAGLNEGNIKLNTTITCTGLYTGFSDYAPACWIYPGGAHGPLNVSEAIEHSCNIFFYTTGHYVGIDRLGKYAKDLGLGEYTGIELPEIKGAMASPERKAEIYKDDENPLEANWYDGNTVAAAIGQSVSQFTPIQLANYCAAIANNGKRYEASILKTVRSFDYSQTIFNRESVVATNADYDIEYYEAIQYGMRQVVESGNSSTVYGIFRDTNYTVAAKTGTSQTGVNQSNDGFFICYAPAENPEIAIAVAMEKGGSGSSQAVIAKEVLDYYFEFASSTATVDREMELIR